MTSRLRNIVIKAQDPRLVADFWCAVLGWELIDEEHEIVEIGPAGGAQPGIDILRIPEPKTGINRLHLDVVADGNTTAEELERLLALGAVRVDVGQGKDVTWAVLADPEGNEFCLLGRSVEDVRAGL